MANFLYRFSKLLNRSQDQFLINPKTGDFSITSLVSKNGEALIISGDYFLLRTIPFDIKKVKGNVLHQNIKINTEELMKVYIAGGLGINYSEKK